MWLSRANNAKRKYPWTWEQVETAGGVRVGIHTGRTNALVAEALAAARLPELAGYRKVRAEVSVPKAPMRADFLLEGRDRAPPCYLEVKNVTAAVGCDGVALFPDAVTVRGRRHLQVLTDVVKRGWRGALVFCAQRGDAREVRPADEIDPDYGLALRRAMAVGVDVYALGAQLGSNGIEVDRRLAVVCTNV